MSRSAERADDKELHWEWLWNDFEHGDQGRARTSQVQWVSFMSEVRIWITSNNNQVSMIVAVDTSGSQDLVYFPLILCFRRLNM